MKRRFFFLLAAAALLLPQAVMASGQRAGSAGSVQTGTDPNLNPVGQLPVVKTKESFTFLIDGGTHDVPSAYLELFEKETNVHVNLTSFEYTAARERMNIMVSSGDYPDAIGGWIGVPVQQYAADGVIIPLEDLIDKYTVNIKAALAQPGARQGVIMDDGHIYSPPLLLDEPTTHWIPWINEKWLNQVDMKMPTTTEELKQVLIAFRDKIPPVNGQKIIPLSSYPTTIAWYINGLAGWFGINAYSTSVMINGQVEYPMVMPQFKEYIKYMADLNANGLLDPELFTQDSATHQAKGKQGLYGIDIAYWALDTGPIVTTDPTERPYDFVPLPVLKAPGVTKPVWNRNSTGLKVFNGNFVISSKAKNPITIIRWLDNLYTEEHSMELKWGALGVKIEKVGNRTYREIDTSGWTAEQNDNYSKSYYFPQIFWERIATGLAELLPPVGKKPNYTSKTAKDLANEIYAPYLEPDVFPRIMYTDEESQKLADLGTAIDTYAPQKWAEWIMGQANVDAEWDAYVAQINKFGLQERLTIMRTALKRTQELLK
jgi:putative aldouronate transport system substrate-binding protein